MLNSTEPIHILTPIIESNHVILDQEKERKKEGCGGGGGRGGKIQGGKRKVELQDYV